MLIFLNTNYGELVKYLSFTHTHRIFILFFFFSIVKQVSYSLSFNFEQQNNNNLLIKFNVKEKKNDRKENIKMECVVCGECAHNSN